MFDLFVFGIDPEKKESPDTIKKHIGDLLKLDDSKLQQILFPEVGKVCIEQNISEQKAQHICQVLRDAGLLCGYEPIKKREWGELSLAPIEADSKPTITNCPNCGITLELEDGLEPEYCYGCNFHVRAYEDKAKERAEYEEIRKQMLQKMQARQEYEQQELREQEEQRKRAQLEEQVLNDLGSNFKKRWKQIFADSAYNKLIVPASLVVLASMGGAGYWFFSAQEQPDPTPVVQAPPKAAPAPIQVTPPATESSIKIANIDELKINQDQSVVASSEPDAQQRISTFLNTQNTSKTDSAPPKSDKMGSENITKQAPAQPATANGENQSFITALYQEFDADQEWITFLNQKIAEQIGKQDFKAAYTLSQIEPRLSDQIRHTASIVLEFYKQNRADLADPLLSNLRKQIQTQPTENQAILKSELGLGLKGNPTQLELFNELDAAIQAIPTPLAQVKALSKAAIFQKSLGQDNVANNNLALAQKKLNEMPASFDQMTGFIELAQQYKQLADKLNAEASLLFAEMALIKSEDPRKEEAYGLLFNSAFGLNISDALATKYLGNLKTPNLRSNAVYKAIQTRVVQNMPEGVEAQLNNIVDPEYAALAYALAGSIEAAPEKKKALFDTAQQKAVSISGIQSKALANSKIARLAVRQGYTDQANGLFEAALSSAKGIENSLQRDAAYIVLATDRSKTLDTDKAKQIVELIQDESLRKSAMKVVESVENVKPLLTNNPVGQ